MTEQTTTMAWSSFAALRFGEVFHFGRRDQVYVKTGRAEYRTKAEPRRYHRVTRPIIVYTETTP